MSSAGDISVASIAATPLDIDLVFEELLRTPVFKREETAGPESSGEDEPDFWCGSEGKRQKIRVTDKATEADPTLRGARQRLNWLNALKQYRRYKRLEMIRFVLSKRDHKLVQKTVLRITSQQEQSVLTAIKDCPESN